MPADRCNRAERLLAWHFGLVYVNPPGEEERRLQQAGNPNSLANCNTDRFGNRRRHEVIPSRQVRVIQGGLLHVTEVAALVHKDSNSA
jgi:hypothetical protein